MFDLPSFNSTVAGLALAEHRLNNWLVRYKAIWKREYKLPWRRAGLLK